MSEFLLSYTANEINEKLGKIDNKLDNSELPEAINDALAQAKASGEFDGKTPVRGTDYWTDVDKAEIKSYVDEAILGGVW
jgi:ABC-type amino acid transport substrate-binding protein